MSLRDLGIVATLLQLRIYIKIPILSVLCQDTGITMVGTGLCVVCGVC